ncbi:Os11g0706801 [Oryza sativa Japonica Group]|uniref:Putative cyclin-D7-1 n=1 Tax=Oryza sativa subsp. japonica TaxID=39947 RepID=CCD71_ORYSJ|nr:RecName: Full=Putative cyclin-D7-1; AltName: Full=G1/S-specific cyclin-D7-1; Short=CycD7;1 [Oryza sativa Japonica Group]AAX95283.1 Cyclin, N-terminal domain, putative [Oryza sativa Japonica Group]AAX95412.1 Cyclin, N-terminal domain, putative [Oryza sativa Japonica Group]ABA95520.1 Cyclin, N-terminal domain containing protein [Oryza sativa Japonica Group]EAZ19328.1 hypothetical protein OsJ_34879 [Oryza sativa Japonica Group]BAT15414.1 Os11g0706801 [Oryza sativa Japonica Group]
MDDDDDTSFNNSLDLYCDEDPFDSTPPPPPPPPEQQQQAGTTTPDDIDDEVMEYYKAKQRCYALQIRDYCCYLQCHHLLLQQQQHGVAAARLKAAMGRLGLEAATAFNAANYLDRFLSINCHLKWEEWMVEVVSVGCLSLACKLDEVTIPSLHDLQMEEAMGHSFRASTIRDMELTLLKALRWRLACVTPFSFLPVTTTTTTTRALLLRSLLDPSFLRFDASLLAASALTLSSTTPQHPNHLLLNRLIHPFSQTDHEVKECFNMMKALHLDMSKNPGRSSDHPCWSPISVVIPFHTDGTVKRSAISRCLFGSGRLKARSI